MELALKVLSIFLLLCNSATKAANQLAKRNFDLLFLSSFHSFYLLFILLRYHKQIIQWNFLKFTLRKFLSLPRISSSSQDLLRSIKIMIKLRLKLRSLPRNFCKIRFITLKFEQISNLLLKKNHDPHKPARSENEKHICVIEPYRIWNLAKTFRNTILFKRDPSRAIPFRLESWIFVTKTSSWRTSRSPKPAPISVNHRPPPSAFSRS